MFHIYSRSLLQEKLSQLQSKNPAFSLRAFAKKIELSPGALSEILSGRRKISRKAATRLMNNPLLEPEERQKLESFLQGRDSEIRRTLKPEIFELIQDWRYFAFLAAGELSSKPQTAEEFAKLFNLPVKEARETLESLAALNLLRLKSDGKFVHTGEHLTTTDEVPSEAIRKSHVVAMDKAKHALATQSLDERDFFSITFPGTSGNMRKAKSEVRKFAQKLCTSFAGAKKDRVYKLGIQLFPLTEIQQEEK